MYNKCRNESYRRVFREGLPSLLLSWSLRDIWDNLYMTGQITLSALQVWVKILWDNINVDLHALHFLMQDDYQSRWEIQVLSRHTGQNYSDAILWGSKRAKKGMPQIFYETTDIYLEVYTKRKKAGNWPNPHASLWPPSSCWNGVLKPAMCLNGFGLSFSGTSWLVQHQLLPWHFTTSGLGWFHHRQIWDLKAAAKCSEQLLDIDDKHQEKIMMCMEQDHLEAYCLHIGSL